MRQAEARKNRYQPAVVIASAMIVGIVCDRLTDTGVYAWYAAAAISLVGWWIAWRREHNRLAAGWLLVVIAATGATWHDLHWRWYDKNEIGRYASHPASPVCVEALALEPGSLQASPRASPFRAIPQTESTRLRASATRLRDGGSWRPVQGEFQLVVDGHLAGVHAGDRLRIYGQIYAPSPARNPGQFDAELHHRADRRLCLVRTESPDCVTLLKSCPPYYPRRWFGNLRTDAIRLINRELPPQQAALLAAMLLGERSRIAPETTALFRRTGALHVLVVSGLHVGLVLGVFYFAMRMGWTSRQPTLLAMMLLALAYAALTGGRPPVIRAVVLAEVMCLGALLGRRVIAFNSLGVAALVVLMINPCELFRTGTQLSFLATATLIWFGRRELEQPTRDPLDQLLINLRPWWRQLLISSCHSAMMLVTASLTVWLVSMPLLLYRFNFVSPIAPPFSLVVFPLVAIAVTAGLGLVTLGGLTPWLAWPLARLSEGALHCLETLLVLGDQLPGATYWAPGPAWWWVVGVYLLLATWLAVRLHLRLRRFLNHLGIAWACLALIPWGASWLQPPECQITFIDVGHGSSVLIEAPDGETWLYDAGSLSSPVIAAEAIASVLWSKRIMHIDAILLSHADVDHYNAVPTLLDRFSVGTVYVSPLMFTPLSNKEDHQSTPAQLQRKLKQYQVEIRQLESGDRLTIDNLTLEVLHPTRMGVFGSDNANSLVVAIEVFGKRILLPGDLEEAGLEALLEQQPYDCDLLMAPHHGSSRSDPAGLAAWCRPEWVVISSGPRSNDATGSYAQTGAEVFKTEQSGAIRFRFDPDGKIGIQTTRK